MERNQSEIEGKRQGHEYGDRKKCLSHENREEERVGEKEKRRETVRDMVRDME